MTLIAWILLSLGASFLLALWGVLSDLLAETAERNERVRSLVRRVLLIEMAEDLAAALNRSARVSTPRAIDRLKGLSGAIGSVAKLVAVFILAMWLLYSLVVSNVFLEGTVELLVMLVVVLIMIGWLLLR